MLVAIRGEGSYRQMIAGDVTIEVRNVGVDGMPISYLSAGNGPPLVLLHGAGGNSLDWRRVLPALARKHRVYAPDLPGSPDSARPVADYSSAFFERFVAAFADALDIERANFVGSSLGGLISLRLALSEPARVGALVLVDSAGLGRAVNPAFTSVNVSGLAETAMPPVENMGRRIPEGLGAGDAALRAPHARPARLVSGAGQAGAIAGLPGSPRDRAALPGGPGRPTRGTGGPAPLLEMPTLFVWGARDRVFPEAQARDAVSRLRRGSLAVIRVCGHLPHIECPGQFVAALNRFLC